MDDLKSGSEAPATDGIRTTGARAVVVGAGLCGLLAASVLSRYFAQVVVLERDSLPATPSHRGGVPQGRHVHLLLAGGLRAMDMLLPGLTGELTAAGAPPLDAAAHWRSRFAAGWLPQFRSGLECHTPSRDLLEWLVRRRVDALSNVFIRPAHHVVGLRGSEPRPGGGSHVTGVVVRAGAADRAAAARSTPGPQGDTVFAADLVVDASGRRSAAPAWLRGLGFASPPETVINAQLGYASRWFERPAGSEDGDIRSPTLVMLHAPDVPRGGVVCPVEQGRWVVTLAGTGGTYPPTDEDGFLSFAERAADPALVEAIRGLEPVGPIFGYRRTENRWRHFERLHRWPEGLVVMGDAVCAFNPVYGQGMSVAALSALALGRWLAGEGGRLRAGAPPTGARRFQRSLKGILAVPWMLATSEDFRWPATVGPRPGAWLRVMHRYLDHVTALAVIDRGVCADFLRVLHLAAKPYILFKPRTAWRVLRRLVGSVRREV